ncbi:MAG: aminotransferase class IV [Candidatus Marinimicrobia bacterium]|nr:aminotransferase class IV [Candidatus Neomarinimicrobiota bacterium]
MLETIVYINGEMLPVNEATVSFRDGGFQFGDGLFETIRFQQGNLFLAENHLQRLRNGLESLDLKLDKSNTELIHILQKLIHVNKIDSGLLRLMITRGEITGTPWNHTGKPGIYISIRPLTPIPEQSVKVVYLEEANYPIIRFNPAIKSMNYIGNMKAKKDAESQGAYEPIFCNSDGIITECAIRNVFYIKDGVLLTPSLDLGVLPGVMRSTIIKISTKTGIKVEEVYIPFETIDDMDEAFISSTGIGLLPCYWDGWNSEFNLTKQIAKKLSQEIHNFCE